jgi:large subunit ribosomal protein L14e
VFKKFVEVGRAVLINYGPLSGKLAVIVDIITTSRVLIDGPTTGVKRQEISLRRVSLTDFTLDITRGIKNAALKSAVEKFDLIKKWGNTPFAKKIHRGQVRAKLTDFDRFKVMVLKKKVKIFELN